MHLYLPGTAQEISLRLMYPARDHLQARSTASFLTRCGHPERYSVVRLSKSSTFLREYIKGAVKSTVTVCILEAGGLVCFVWEAGALGKRVFERPAALKQLG